MILVGSERHKILNKTLCRFICDYELALSTTPSSTTTLWIVLHERRQPVRYRNVPWMTNRSLMPLLRIKQLRCMDEASSLSLVLYSCYFPLITCHLLLCTRYSHSFLQPRKLVTVSDNIPDRFFIDSPQIAF